MCLTILRDNPDAIASADRNGGNRQFDQERFRGVSVTTMAAGTLDFYRFLHGNSKPPA